MTTKYLVTIQRVAPDDNGSKVQAIIAGAVIIGLVITMVRDKRR
jgi:hypothetical protein